MKRFARNQGRPKTHVYDTVTKTYVCPVVPRKPVGVKPSQLPTGTLCWTCMFNSIIAGDMVFKS